jgi:hypothetical protein
VVSSVFSRFSVFGFSGSRSSVPAGCSVAAAAVPVGSRVVVGCARGVDEFFRGEFPSASVFSASSFGAGRGSFARRSVAVVSSVASRGGLWVSFPASPCPPGLFPSSSSSRCFCGSGSGSWGSLAFALGSGVPCLVFLGSLPVPSGWGLFPVSGSPGWFGCGVVCCVSPPLQLCLF